MDKNGSFHYCETSKFQAIKLPYENSRLAMYVFLPRQSSSLEAFLENLTSAAWDEWMKKFESLPGHLRLPRFKLTYGAELRAALGKLGMGIAFEPARARFDDISLPPPSIWIGQVLHRAFVEVNEKGTEAAAVTVATIRAMGRWQPPTRTFEMIVNRPFFFAIRDDVTGTVLFLGAVRDPGIT